MGMVTTTIAMLPAEEQTSVATKSNDTGLAHSFADAFSGQISQDMNTRATTDANQDIVVPSIPKSGPVSSVPGGHINIFDKALPQIEGSAVLGHVLDNAEISRDDIQNVANETSTTGMTAKVEEDTVTLDTSKVQNDTPSERSECAAGGGSATPKGSLQIVANTHAVSAQVSATIGSRHPAMVQLQTGTAIEKQESSTKEIAKRQKSKTTKSAAIEGANPIRMTTVESAKCAAFPSAQGTLPPSPSVTVAGVQAIQPPSKENVPQSRPACTVSAGQQNVGAQANGENKSIGDAHAAKASAGGSETADTLTAGDSNLSQKDRIRLEKDTMPAQFGAGDTPAKVDGVTSPAVSAHMHASADGFASTVAARSVALPSGIADAGAARVQSVVVGDQLIAAHMGTGETHDYGAAAMPLAGSEAHRTLFATPSILEVAVPNGTQGWLKIRAEMASGGGITASLSAASSTGQAMLHRELSSLTAYLQQERIPVNTVTVHGATARSGWGDQPGSLSSAMHGQLHQGSGRRRGGQQAAGMPSFSGGIEKVTVDETNELAMHMPYAGSGNWLSVRA